MLLGDVDVSVKVADKALAEYNVEEPNGREKNCYIPSEAGKVCPLAICGSNG